MVDTKKRTVEAQVISGIFKGLGFIVGMCVLGSIFCPFNIRSDEKRRQAACMSNEKLIGLAVFQYAQDNDGLMPKIVSHIRPEATWRNAVSPYIRSKVPFQCPSRDDTTVGADGLGKSYAANDSGKGVFGRLWTKPPTLSSFPEPASLIAVCEVEGDDAPGFNIDASPETRPDEQVLWAGHMGGSNYLFLDGHVKWFRPLDKRGRWYSDPHKPLSTTGEAILKDAQERGGR